MKNWIERLLHNEAVMYIIVGGLTTVVNFVFFHGIDLWLSHNGMSEALSYKIAYVIAFLTAVLFAYWANKFYVFRNYDLHPGYLIREFTKFFSARVISGVLTFVLMILFVDFLHFGHTFAWLATTVVNLVFNYVASKFFIFKGEKTA